MFEHAPRDEKLEQHFDFIRGFNALMDESDRILMRIVMIGVLAGLTDRLHKSPRPPSAPSAPN